MALTECVECGGKVSTRTEACPHCGYRASVAEERSVSASGGISVRGVVLTITIVVVGLGMSCGILMETKVIPDVSVMSGDELPERVRTFMIDQQMIELDEEILLFYSDAMLFYSADGNVVTDRRVLSYQEVDGELMFWWLGYQEITEVDVVDAGDFWTSAVIDVYGRVDGEVTTVQLWVAADGVERVLNTIAELRP